MRTLLAFFMLSTAVFAASDLPKNLLRYNTGALPVIRNTEGQWVSVAPESLDWNAPYAAILGGDIGKTMDLSKTKMYVVDLSQVESLERFSLFSQSATGSVSVFSSPVFEDPQTGNWSELGSLTLGAGQSSTLTSTPADARYLKFVFSADSKGIVGPMGAFGTLTFNDVRPADVLQTPDSQLQKYDMNYATPATDLAPTASEPSQTTEELMALFDDDPATQLNVTAPTTITVDLGANREVEALYFSANTDSPISVRFGNTPDELSQAEDTQAHAGSKTTLPAQVNARYASIRLNPTPGNPASINTLALVGPVDPNALVFERQPHDETVGGAATTGAGAIRAIAPANVRVTSE